MNQNEKRLWTQTLWDPLDEKNKSPYESNKSGIRVAAYCRISGGSMNNESSLINQVHHFTEMIYKRSNWKFVGVYIDEKISGATVKYRPGFSRLLRHAEEGRIDLILTKSISRFCRNTAELIETVNRLKELGVAIYFQKEQIDTSKNYNNLLLECYASVAQDEIETSSQNALKGYEQRLQRGKPNFRNMFGYDRVQENGETTFIINPDEADVVRWIYMELINGKTCAEITRELNQSGTRTKKDAKFWSSGYVKHILTEVAYTGDKLTGIKVKDLLTGDVSYNKGERPQYYITGSHPAIISHEVFELAGQRMQASSHTFPSEKIERTKKAFSGRLECGLCSSVIRRGNYHNWTCQYALSTARMCSLPKFRDHEINDMAIKAFVERFVRKGQQRDGYSEHDPLDIDSAAFQRFIKEIGKIIIRVNQNDHFEFHRLKYFNAIELLDSMNTDDADKKRDELKAEYKDFEKRISKIENDRIFRNQSLEWLETVKSMDDFIEGMTDEIARAWIMGIVIYSKTAYIVKWIDEEETVIGKEEIAEIEKNKWESPGNLKASRPGPPGEVRSFEGVENVDRAVEYDEISKRVELLGPEKSTNMPEIIENEKQGLVTSANRHHIKLNNNVIKLEPGMGIGEINGIRRNISKSKATEMLGERNLKVAAYCRVSTDTEEQKVSMQTQIAYYTYLILKNKKWDFAGIYADEGFSGTNISQRKDFNRMIDDVRKGKIDLIITKSISRFSRNTVDVLSILKLFRELPHNPEIFFEKEGLRSNDEKSALMISLMGGLSQNEIANLSSNVKWGMQKYAQRGISVWATDQYGFTIDKSRNWHIVPQEAEVIRWIYQEFIEKRSISAVITGLHEKGIKSPSGNEYWSNMKLREVLTCEKMKGDYVYQKTYSPEVIGSKPKVNRGKVPKIYIEKHHEPIVSEEIWAKAQEAFTELSRSRTHEWRQEGTAGRECYYNRFNCGQCGGTITRYRSKERDSKDGSSWRCYNSYIRTDVECAIDRAFSEKYLDYHFMRALEKIRDSLGFKEMVDEIIETIRLTDTEEQHEKELRDEIGILNQELYEAVEDELSRHGYDTAKINELTDRIINLRNEMILYHDRIEKVDSIRSDYDQLIKILREHDFVSFRDFHNMRPRIKPGQSLYETTKNTKDKTYINEKGPDHFREELFQKYVVSGVIHDDGRIEYDFSMGVKFGADMTYQDYLDEFKVAKDEINFEELVNSKEVKKLRKFCKKPQKTKEMREHIGISSNCSFYKRVLDPLYQAGVLQLDKGLRRNTWRYYWQD